VQAGPFPALRGLRLGSRVDELRAARPGLRIITGGHGQLWAYEVVDSPDIVEIRYRCDDGRLAAIYATLRAKSITPEVLALAKRAFGEPRTDSSTLSLASEYERQGNRFFRWRDSERNIDLAGGPAAGKVLMLIRRRSP
jgi:hypothetical protein